MYEEQKQEEQEQENRNEQRGGCKLLKSLSTVLLWKLVVLGTI